jgi:hypothetical protein
MIESRLLEVCPHTTLPARKVKHMRPSLDRSAAEKRHSRGKEA